MRRLVVMAVLICLLAACRDEAALTGFAESRTPPALAGRFFPPEGWAWGYVQTGGGPPQRYGVAAPRGLVPQADILVVVGSGEIAEAWFETVADLNRRGATVWVLERAGQAGSGRYAEPRDLMHAPSFDPDVASVRAMIRLIIRPGPDRAFFLMGQGDGAVVALRAAELGFRADGLILSAPQLAPTGGESPMDGLSRRLGQGSAKASGWTDWARDGPDAFARKLTHDRWRGGVQHAWQLANPDLRMSGESIAWRQGLRDAGKLARRDAGAVRAPTLMLLQGAPDSGAQSLCDAVGGCRIRRFVGAGPALPIEADTFRTPWLESIAGFANLR